MAKMSIDLYRGIVKNARKLLENHQNYINGTDLNGLTLPMIFYDEIQEKRSTINQCIGELTIVIKTLPKDSSEEYRNILQELKMVEIQLKEIEKSFL